MDGTSSPKVRIPEGDSPLVNKRRSMETLRLFIRFALLPATVVRALKVAAVVTPILTVLNHAQEIMALDFTVGFFLQMALTFCVPYLVSTYSSAMTEVATVRAAQPDRAVS